MPRKAKRDVEKDDPARQVSPQDTPEDMASTPNTHSIKKFVKNTLGCACPDEVFTQIECNEEYDVDGSLPPCKRLLIGHRLLIYLWHVESLATMRSNLVMMAESGRKERDDGAYNRFRLVLSTPCPEDLTDAARELFSPLSTKDDRIHLHVVRTGELPEIHSSCTCY